MKKVADLIVSLLPAKARPYAKSVMALILSVGAVVATLAGAPAWVPLVLVVLNAPVVYGVPNEDYEGEHVEL